MNVAQPAISRAVRELEKSLGMQLLERTTREVSLTPEGEALARGAARSWQTIEGALRQAKQIQSGHQGEIVVGYSAQAAHGPMSQILRRFREKAPDIRLKLQLNSSEEQVDLLQLGRIDVGFLLSSAVPAELANLHLVRDRFVALVPSMHPLSNKPVIQLGQLAQEPFILGTMERWRMFRMLIESTCLQEGFRPNVAGVADDTPLLLEMVASGQGVSLYGSHIARVMPPGVVALPLIGKAIEFDIGLAWDRGSVTPATEALIDHVRAETAPG